MEQAPAAGNANPAEEREVLGWLEFGDAARFLATDVLASGFAPDFVIAIAFDLPAVGGVGFFGVDDDDIRPACVFLLHRLQLREAVAVNGRSDVGGQLARLCAFTWCTQMWSRHDCRAAPATRWST